MLDLSASTSGTTYTIKYLTSGTCPDSATFSLTIVAQDDPTFSYASATYCPTGTDPTPTITGTPGGIFSAIPAHENYSSKDDGNLKRDKYDFMIYRDPTTYIHYDYYEDRVNKMFNYYVSVRGYQLIEEFLMPDQHKVYIYKAPNIFL